MGRVRCGAAKDVVLAIVVTFNEVDELALFSARACARLGIRNWAVEDVVPGVCQVLKGHVVISILPNDHRSLWNSKVFKRLRRNQQVIDSVGEAGEGFVLTTLSEQSDQGTRITHSFFIGHAP
jgi:hypothetical protein